MKLSYYDILKIAAFVPAYGDGVGQGLALYYRDGNTGWLAQGLRSFITQLARFFTVSVKDVRRKYGPLLGQVNLVPLVLSPFMLFVPLKVRSPRVNGDPAYGYFRLRSIVGAGREPSPCTIELEGGQKITIRQSYRSVQSRLRRVRSLELALLEQFCRALEVHHYFPQAEGFRGDPLQENLYVHGIKTIEGKEEEKPLELHNLMEELVRQRMDEVIAVDSSSFCPCMQCRLDAMAIALNSLPPRYVVTERGEIYSKAEALEIQRFVDVVAAVTKALRMVREKPRHATR
jgi:competence protein ComFB